MAARAELGLGGEIAVLRRAGRKQRGSGRCGRRLSPEWGWHEQRLLGGCGRVRIVLSQTDRAAAAAVVRIWAQT